MSQSTPINRLPRNNPGNANTMIMPNAMGMQQDQNLPSVIPDNQQMLPPPQQMPPNMQQMPPPPQQMPQENNQLVDDILREMGTPPGEDNNTINSDMMDYSMDPSQIPPEKLPGNFLESRETRLQEELPNKMVVADSKGNILGLNIDTSTTFGKTFMMIKNPITVLIISLLLSLPHFNRLLFGLLPKLLLESGQVSFYGVLLKAVIGMVIYVGVNLLI